MLLTELHTKQAKLEALEQLLNYADRNRECWMVQHEDGSLTKPLIDDSDYEYCHFNAWDELVTLLQKEVSK